jgi:hypothetical protein
MSTLRRRDRRLGRWGRGVKTYVGPDDGIIRPESRIAGYSGILVQQMIYAVWLFGDESEDAGFVPTEWLGVGL